MCAGVRIISTKTALEKLVMISRIRRGRSYAIQAVQCYDNNGTEAISTHVRKHYALFGDNNGQYFV